MQEWGRVLHDDELARAIIDRTLHHGEYLKLQGASYRLKDRKLELDLTLTDNSDETQKEKK